MSTAEEESDIYPITPLRGAAIGLVSGLKGGGPAGALGGALLMVSSTAATGQWTIILFTLIFSLTTGLMAGVLLGLPYGALAGGLSGGLLARRPQTSPRPLWLLVGALLTAGLGGWLYQSALWLGLLIGALLGLLAGHIAARDFQRVVAQQQGAAS